MIEIPTIVRYAALGWMPGSVPEELSFSVGGKLEYGAPGKLQRILFESGLHQPKVSFSGRGIAGTSRDEPAPVPITP